LDNIGEYYLYAGELFAHSEPHIVTTVLGSCISVCLWDSVIMIGGINHYQLALWNGEGLASPKYGNIAIEKLYEKLIHLGCSHKHIKAKVFGGASVLDNINEHLNVGEKNIVIAQELLKEFGIKTIATDVGGLQGRKLKFNTQTGVVLIKKIIKQTKLQLQI